MPPYLTKETKFLAPVDCLPRKCWDPNLSLPTKARFLFCSKSEKKINFINFITPDIVQKFRASFLNAYSVKLQYLHDTWMLTLQSSKSRIVYLLIFKVKCLVLIPMKLNNSFSQVCKIKGISGQKCKIKMLGMHKNNKTVLK